MNIPCPDRVDCGTGPSVNGFDWPITNYSSEDPDREVFIAVDWGNGPHPIDNYPCIGPNCGPPNKECFVIATSFESIKTAQYCANRATILCSNGESASADVQVDCEINNRVNPPPEDPTIKPVTLVGNDPQTCSVQCLDGTTFYYTVPAGTFLSVSKTDANRQAYSAACREAELKRTCGTPGGGACPHMLCAGDFWELQLGDGSLVDYEIISGSLPPGISMDSNGHISGEVGNSYGEYIATVQVSTGVGALIQYTVWTRVWGITNDRDLEAGRIGFAYSAQLLTQGQIPGNNPTFGTVHNFGFPDGLTLSSSGLISGTPTTAGDYSFAVWASDGCGGYCEKTLDLTVYAVGSAKITTVRCPTDPSLTVTLSPPIETGRYNGPAGTNQNQLDTQAFSDAMVQAQAQLAAAGCGCYIVSFDAAITVPHSGRIVTSSCNFNLRGYYLSGGILNAGVMPIQNFNVTPAGANLHQLYYNSGYAPGATSDWYFFKAGSVIAIGNHVLMWHHTEHHAVPPSANVCFP